jgi:hypothetical protein
VVKETIIIEDRYLHAELPESDRTLLKDAINLLRECEPPQTAVCFFCFGRGGHEVGCKLGQLLFRVKAPVRFKR